MTVQNYRTNFLQNNGFKMVVPKFRDLEFFSHSFIFPSLSLPAAVAETPFTKIPLSGDAMDFGPLTFSFMVDENLDNYFAVVDWIKSISYATTFKDYTDFKGKNKNQPLGEEDVAIMFLDSKNLPTKIVRFVNAVPVSLGGFEITAQQGQTTYVTSDVTFMYEYFDIINDLGQYA